MAGRGERLLAGRLRGGGGGGSPIAGGPTPTPTSAPAATPSPTACALSSRKTWVKGQFDEWYLFPSLLDPGVNAAAFNDVQSYIDALVFPARAESKDRYFTYITSIVRELRGGLLSCAVSSSRRRPGRRPSRTR